MQHFSGAPFPGFGKQRLPVGDHRSLCHHDGFTPARFRLSGWIEFVSNAGTSHKCELAVHQQQLAVVTGQVPQPLSQMKRIVEFQIDAAAAQTLAVRVAESARTEVVKHDPHVHAARCSRDQGVDETVGDGPGFEQVYLQKHVMLGFIDRLQHARKKTVAVNQKHEAVAGAPWKSVLGMCRMALHPAAGRYSGCGHTHCSSKSTITGRWSLATREIRR